MNDQHNELQDLLKNNVTVNTNIVVRFQGGGVRAWEGSKETVQARAGEWEKW